MSAVGESASPRWADVEDIDGVDSFWPFVAETVVQEADAAGGREGPAGKWERVLAAEEQERAAFLEAQRDQDSDARVDHVRQCRQLANSGPDPKEARPDPWAAYRGVPEEDIAALEEPRLSFDWDRKLGEGGFGVVYAGTYGGRPCALKVAVDEDEADAEEEEEAAFAELALAKRCQHEHVIAVLGSGYFDGRFCMAFEFCAGGSLEAWLQRQPAGILRPVADIRSLMRQLLSAVQHVHSLGIVHRDIKPANLLLSGTPSSACDEPSCLKLADFGLAEEAPAHGDCVEGQSGTVPYMAPEQLRGRSYLGSDMWACGCVICELVCEALLPDALCWESPSKVLAWLCTGQRCKDDLALKEKIVDALWGRSCSNPVGVATWDLIQKMRKDANWSAVRIRLHESPHEGVY